MLKLIKITFIILISFSTILTALAQKKVDFSGAYLIDTIETTFNNQKQSFVGINRSLIPKWYRVQQFSDYSIISRIAVYGKYNGNGPEMPKSVDTLKFDGEKFERYVVKTTSKSITSSSLNWITDSQFKINLDINNGEILIEDIWSKPTKNILKIDRSVLQSDGYKYSIQAIFRKQ